MTDPMPSLKAKQHVDICPFDREWSIAHSPLLRRYYVVHNYCTKQYWIEGQFIAAGVRYCDCGLMIPEPVQTFVKLVRL